jgi:hypothetical protein
LLEGFGKSKESYYAMTPPLIAAAYNAGSRTDTPRTDEYAKKIGKSWIAFARTLELQLNEARALLIRISDGAEPVLMAEEIEEFLDRTELP